MPRQFKKPTTYLRCVNCRGLIPINYRVCTQCGFDNSTDNRKAAIKAYNKSTRQSLGGNDAA